MGLRKDSRIDIHESIREEGGEVTPAHSKANARPEALAQKGEWEHGPACFMVVHSPR